MNSSVHRALDTVWRMESARLIGGLARVVGEVGLAEDLAQDAMVAALEQWPGSGIPDNPGAWLMTVARRRGVDLVRRDVTLQAKLSLLARDFREADATPAVVESHPHVEDDVLRLMFTVCHPMLSVESRVGLTLKLVAGMSTAEIARAFVIQVSTMAARITRAKKALARAGTGFHLPAPDQFTGRLASVLETVYLIFNEGYAATSGDRWARADLCQEAIRLGRMLA